MAVMIAGKRVKFGCSIGFFALASLAAAVVNPRAASADDAVALSLTLKDHKFDPAELHAPAGKPIDIRVKNLGDIVFEFESSELHFEKIVPPGGEAVVHVRPQQPGRYNFIDDFHHETQGSLIIP
jgi:heme/copper-type cytochrome/quinol oxidase subunit 2